MNGGISISMTFNSMIVVYIYTSNILEHDSSAYRDDCRLLCRGSVYSNDYIGVMNHVVSVIIKLASSRSFLLQGIFYCSICNFRAVLFPVCRPVAPQVLFLITSMKEL